MTKELNKRLLSVAEYHKMAEVGILSRKDKVELILGEIFYRSPIGSKHQATIDRLNRIFSRIFSDQTILRIQGPVQLENHSEPEPDLLLLKPKEDFYASQHPQAKDVLLLIEVADSSAAFDREVKLPLYAQAGIPEYWIIDLNLHQIEVYHSPEGNTYHSKTILSAADKVSCLAFPTSEFPVSDLIGPASSV